MTTWQLYVITRLDILHDFSSVVAVLLAVGTAFGLFAAKVIQEDDNSKVYHWKWSLVTGPLCLLLTLTALFLPTAKEAAFIVVGSKLSTFISENKDAQQIPSKVLNLANSWLEKLKPEKK